MGRALTGMRRHGNLPDAQRFDARRHTVNDSNPSNPSMCVQGFVREAVQVSLGEAFERVNNVR
jgi:hypothetical protein